MKKTVTVALALCLTLLFGCANDKPAESAMTESKYGNEMKIPYAVDLSPEDGADSVERQGDHVNSPLCPSDFFRMRSTDTLTILTA